MTSSPKKVWLNCGCLGNPLNSSVDFYKCITVNIYYSNPDIIPVLQSVSIIIPCYNAQEFVAEAIQSALDQTHQSCEIIVIDDGSTDGSLKQISSFGDRIRYETGPHLGGCAARNRGLELATGSWIQFLDADDRISPEKIECQLAALSHCDSNASLAVSPWRHFMGLDCPSSTALMLPPPQNTGVEFLMAIWAGGLMFPPHAWLTPKALIRQVGGWDTRLLADQDGEFFSRVLIAANQVVAATGGEAQYRTPGPGNVSARNSEESMQSRFNAWHSVQQRLMELRSDKQARRAVLRRLQSVAYLARQYPKIIEQCHHWETRLRSADFNFRPPFVFNVLCSFFGLKRALRFRALFRR